MMTFWHSLDSTMQAAIVSVGGMVLTAVLALLGLGFQLSAQRKQSNEDIAENERRKLKAAMYEDGVRVTRELIDASTALSTPIRILNSQVRFIAAIATHGQAFSPPRTSVNDLLERWQEVQENAIRFIFLVEERRFIDPHLLVFRTAMNSAIFDARQSMDGALFAQLFDKVQHQLPDGQWSEYTAPSVAAAEKFNGESERLFAALDEMTSYGEDFLVELQNALLGDLFGHKVTHRVPIDPNSKVISLANYDALEDWFNNSTPWGRYCAQIEAETQERLAPGGDGAA